MHLSGSGAIFFSSTCSSAATALRIPKLGILAEAHYFCTKMTNSKRNHKEKIIRHNKKCIYKQFPGLERDI